MDHSPHQNLSPWRRREVQCNALVNGIQDAADDDIILLSDVDEICTDKSIRALRTSPPRRHEVACFELRMFNYFLNAECGVRWLRSGPRAILKKDLRTMERLRKVRGPAAHRMQDLVRAIAASREMGRPITRRLVRDAGWHFSYLGGVDAIIEKMKSFAGHDRVPLDIRDPERLAAKIAAASPISFALSGLRFREIDETFPLYVRQNRQKFAHLIAQI